MFLCKLVCVQRFCLLYLCLSTEDDNPELGNNGKIQSYYPLEEEIYATQWIGGVIVLSARRKLEPIMPEKNFKTFLAQATRTNTKIQECYAWHIANFDIVREEFVPQSHIIRL